MGRKRTGSVTAYLGRWRASVGREYLGLFEDRGEAWRVVKAWLQTENDTAPDSLRTYGKKWFEARELEGLVRGIAEERSVWASRIETASFIDRPMRSVRPRDIDQHLRNLLKQRAIQVGRKGTHGSIRTTTTRPLSRQSVVHARRVLLACFTSAAIEGKVQSNPVRDVPVPKVARVVENEDAWAFLTLEEIKALFRAIDAFTINSKSDKARERETKRRVFYRTVYTVAIYAGLRRGEMWGLRWQDVDLDSKTPHLTVRKSYNDAPKTASSRRSVPLLPETRAALLACKRAQSPTPIAGLVFPSDGGGCFGRSYDAAWERWRALVGIRDHVTFHDLRHTCLTHLTHGSFGQKLEPLDVMRWAGHGARTPTRRSVPDVMPGSLAGKPVIFVENRLKRLSGRRAKTT